MKIIEYNDSMLVIDGCLIERYYDWDPEKMCTIGFIASKGMNRVVYKISYSYDKMREFLKSSDVVLECKFEEIY